MEKLRTGLAGAAVTGALCLLIISLTDTTHQDTVRLTAVSATLRSGPHLANLTRAGADRSQLDTLNQLPMFVMTTGAGAYTEKRYQLFGISISSGRRAALISIDGAPASWVRVGEVTGDAQLVEVTTLSVRFDTPVGERIVSLNDTASAASPAPAPSAGTLGVN